MANIFNMGVIWIMVVLSSVYRNSKSSHQDFSKTANSKWFVDKTMFIRDFLGVNEPSEPNVKVITGPKRFGKSTVVDMVKRFLQIQVYAADGKPVDLMKNTNYNLFCRKPLEICRNNSEFILKHFGQHPVIHVSFSPLKNVTGLDTFRGATNEMIRNSYSKHKYFLNDHVTPPLYSGTKQAFRKIIAKRLAVDETKYYPRLAEILHDYFGEKAVILVDDYDALGCRESFESAIDYDEIIKRLNSLILSLFKRNKHLSSALLTGGRCVEDTGLSPSLKGFTEFRFVGQNYSSKYRGFIKTIKTHGT